MKSDILSLEKELDKTKKDLEASRKAIWDMLNYANMYVVILDRNMVIKLINYSLATELGFKSEDEPIGLCWLDFIPPKDHDRVSTIHKKLSIDQDMEHYGEVSNKVKRKDGSTMLVKWFNVPINSEYNVTLSFGLSQDKVVEITEDSVRSYYADILQKDKTMIQSLKDSLFGERETKACTPEGAI